jgi:hypothetical protein
MEQIIIFICVYLRESVSKIVFNVRLNENFW